MTVWAWLQPADRIWKVVSDPEKGTLEVYNERNDLVMKQKGLRKEAVVLIEENFLGIVATKLTGDNKEDNKWNEKNTNKKISDYNPMYV